MSSEKNNTSSIQMREIVINTCYGGFGLSEKAGKLYCERINLDYENLEEHRLNRSDPILIEVIKELGTNANAIYAQLEIVSLPIGTKYRICEYEGSEYIETIESIRWKIA
jgi:hypothetical protein